MRTAPSITREHEKYRTSCTSRRRNGLLPVELNASYRVSPTPTGGLAFVIKIHLSSGKERSLKHAVPEPDGICTDRQTCSLAVWVFIPEHIILTPVRAPDLDSWAGVIANRLYDARRRGGACVHPCD